MAHPNFLLNSSTLVIGGSSGIGYAVASAALANDSKVHITSVTSEKLSAKVSQLQALYPNAHVKGSVADLSSTETVEATLQAVLDAAVNETGGPLDHIVYTSGSGEGRTYFLDHPHLGTARARPRPGTSPMIGVAGAVEVLSRALAVDLAPIRVNVVIPGIVNTELAQKITGGDADVLDRYKAASLTKEIGTPEGSAEAYLFCMRSALATGQGFKIDNGSSLVSLL
ncbi:hypothetical protein C8R45DRAFT_1168655 [Mycena sanguinolenta]|nr:hypothetical protein C8R45DRAFT_1168655 [Mycena sanguinolenta]